MHLARAIELASNGTWRVKPNPVVGAVVARDGEILGEGWHREYGGAHAEVNAIEACGLADLTGATLYVSLEPCCHEGKTPPCTGAILQSGIRRVVVGSDDPTEKASGRGLGILRDEGVEVVLAGGELAASARLLNQAFRKHARVGRPWVLFKSAMTLDGKVATRTGDSKWISGEESRELAHRWRASVDAVVVGHRHGARRRSAADRPPRWAARRAVRAAAARGVRLAGAPAAQLPARGRRRRDPAHDRRLARSRAGRHRRARSGRNPGDRGHRRERARARSLGAGPAGDDGRGIRAARGRPTSRWRVPRRRARSTRSACSWRRCCSAGAPPRDPLEGEGVGRISEALRALTCGCESVGEDLLVSARLREW